MALSMQSEKATTSLRLIDLPPFPGIAVRALQLVSKSETRLHELHELICMDQVLASEILKLANSPLYGIRTEVTTTTQAVILLGFERVKGLLLTVAMRAYIGDAWDVPALRACWRHSVACAMIAEEISGANAADRDTAYTAALIHDIGRLALAVMQPEGYSQLRTQTFDNAESILQCERKMFRMDHCHAGRLLMMWWNLPEELIEVTSHHHAAKNSGKFDLLALVSLSCNIADALEFTFIRPADARGYKDLLGQLTADKQGVLPAEPDEFRSRIAEKISCMESMLGPIGAELQRSG
jgi:putative nucleotidyltransferase with HDIG domain